MGDVEPQDFNWTAQIRSGFRRGEWLAGVGEGCGGAAIADGRKLAGVAQVAATVHGLTNRGHREKAETMATSPEPFAWPGKATDAVAAMAGDENLVSDRENGSRSCDLRT
jgi:hypothetical protein